MTRTFRHAFVMNCHRDVAVAVRTLNYLRAWWPTSRCYLYCDGPDSVPIDAFSGLSTDVHCERAPYEPRKSHGIIQALNRLVAWAAGDAMEVVSFLHADMIPLHPATFYAFVARFAVTDRRMTWTPSRPDSPYPDFCNLHFRLPQAVDAGYFALRCDETLHGPNDFNEAHLSRSLDQVHAEWRAQAYPMWMLSLPFWRNEAVSYQGGFIFHNFTPESSVVHTNDPWFWDHYAEIAGFAPRRIPEGIG
ncbi:MAG: hypothetical protein HY696_00460 [Deltaproteobacteria bacterium]|nr:hypothetical protein [Deltaproteobacteria bacterium]